MAKKKRKKKQTTSDRKQSVSIKTLVNVSEGDANDLIEKYRDYRNVIPHVSYQ